MLTGAILACSLAYVYGCCLPKETQGSRGRKGGCYYGELFQVDDCDDLSRECQDQDSDILRCENTKPELRWGKLVWCPQISRSIG